MLDKILGLIAEGISKHAGTGNVSVSSATVTTLKSLTLDKGLWLIVGHNQWTESFSNPFVLSLTGLPRGDVVNRGTGTNGGGLNVIALEKIDQPTTIKLNAYQPSGSAKTSNQIRLDAVKICLGGGYCIAVFSMLSAIGRWWEHVRQNTEFPRSKTRTIRGVIPAIKAFVIALFWDIRPSAQDCETVHLCKIEPEYIAVRRSFYGPNEVSAQKRHWHAVHMYDIKRVHCCLLCCSKNKWTNSSVFRQFVARNSDYWRIHHLIPERGWEIC